MNWLALRHIWENLGSNLGREWALAPPDKFWDYVFLWCLPALLKLHRLYGLNVCDVTTALLPLGRHWISRLIFLRFCIPSCSSSRTWIAQSVEHVMRTRRPRNLGMIPGRGKSIHSGSGLFQPTIQWVSGTLFPGVRRLGREAPGIRM